MAYKGMPLAMEATYAAVIAAARCSTSIEARSSSRTFSPANYRLLSRTG
jgi:hypothetical protein